MSLFSRKETTVEFTSLLFFAILFVLPIGVFCQQPDSLFKKIDTQLLQHNNDGFFIGLDKTLYQTGEKIWFAGYNLDNKTPPNKLHTLHILLVNDMLQTVVNEQHFVIDKGLCNGSMHLSDSLQTGEYSIIAYTNLFAAQPSRHSFFRQSIEVIGTRPIHKISFADAGKTMSDSLFLTARIIRADIALPHNATLQYNMYANGRLIKKEKRVINVFGEVALSIPSSLMVQTPEITGTISEEKETGEGNKKTKEKQTTAFKLPLLWESKNYLIKLFAENGALISNQQNKVYFQITSTASKAVAANLQLLEDSLPVASFESDVYGAGLFEFVPRKGHRYIVNFQDDTAHIIQQFPEIKEQAYNIQVIRNDMANDSLMFFVTSPAVAAPSIISFYNNNDIFDQLTVQLIKGKGLLNISAKDWVKGVCSISLHDNNAVLQARQTISLLPDTSQSTVTITTDSSEYRKRSVVKVHISIKDKNGSPVRSVFSLSAALTKTITERYTDIVRFNYFDRFMDNGFVKPSLSELQGKVHLKKTLTDFNNNQINYRDDNKDINQYIPNQFDGTVTRNDGSKIKKPVEVAVLSPGITKITATKEGNFKIPIEALRSNMNDRILLSVNQNDKNDYKIILNTAEKKLNNLLALKYFSLLAVTKKDEASVQQKEEMQRYTGNVLQEVTVKASNNSYYFGNNQPCNDHICIMGALNCPTHPGGKIAVDGDIYHDYGSTQTKIYHCRQKTLPSPVIALQPTYYGDNFKAVDLTKISDTIPFSPELLYRSTLYWMPSIITNEKGEADVQFYTNDIKGKFLCLLQGISSKGVLHGKTEFVVK